MDTITLPAKYPEMSWQERREARMAYVDRQKGDCYYCKYALSGDPSPDVMSKRINWRLFPKNFLRNPVHLHHSHKTGLTIGAVHARCNAVLWQFHGE